MNAAEEFGATRVIVVDRPGDATAVELYRADQCVVTLQLGPVECVALAADLLNAARRRFGRSGP